MRKRLFVLATALFFFGQLMANPVDVNRAYDIALRFAQNNLSSAKDIKSVDLVHTLKQQDGTSAVYVFNYDKGFVVVAGDDISMPILGYSEEGAFDVDNIPDGLNYYLHHYLRQIEFGRQNGLNADEEASMEWEKLEKEGMPRISNEMKVVNPLVTLSWDQSYPYNYFCPSHYSGPGGHCYAGCVATAMSMVMKYWNWPDRGTGTHTYTPEGFPEQTVNFENASYAWNNMPNSLGYNSPSAQIQAVGLLMYHCGVSVDMQYGYGSSGAFSQDVPAAISTYFKYTEHTRHVFRDNYTKTEWENMLMANLDQGFPAYYSGSDSEGGHAFVCAGYDANRRFFFNWGWSGSGNGFFYIDALNVMGSHFNEGNTCILDFVPDYIYDEMIPAVTDLSVRAINANSKTAIVSWTNPSVNMSGAPISDIERVVVERNGAVVFSQENIVAGEPMNFTDEVSLYDCYTYSIHFVSNGVKGRYASTKYQFGPTCTWKVVGQTTNFQGWNDGKIQVLNSYGTVIDEVTLTSSTPVSQQLRIPEGNVSFKWVAPSTLVNNLTINIKNSSNETVYSYSGASSGIPTGVILAQDNDCGGCLPPDNLTAVDVFMDGVLGTLVSWEYASAPKSFKVYRSDDNVVYAEIAEVDKNDRQYFDPAVSGSYYYKVTAYRNYCESTPAWTSEGEDYVFVDVTTVYEYDGGMSLFPNPSDDVLTVKAEGIEQVAVASMLGQVVYSARINADELVLNTSSFDAGIYMLTIKTKNGSRSYRFAVIH